MSHVTAFAQLAGGEHLGYIPIRFRRVRDGSILPKGRWFDFPVSTKECTADGLKLWIGRDLVEIHFTRVAIGRGDQPCVGMY